MPSRINPGARQNAGRVAPFGHPQIAGCQRLPGAFRRVAASFIGRRRQGIHHAPIIAAIPRSLTRRGQSPPDQEPNRRAPKRPESLGPPVASRPSPTPVASTPCRRSLKIVVPRRNSDVASEQLLFSFCDFGKLVRIKIYVCCARTRKRNGFQTSSAAARSWRSHASGCQCAGAARQAMRPVPPRWSRGDSNPGPPPCKGGALPAKLRPLVEASPRWARLDSNQGPRPYQGRALTD